MAAILTVGLVGSALFAWFSLFWLVPSNLCAMFRYRLWRIRDELAEEIRSGSFDHDEEPERVVEAIECFIESAKDLTPMRIALMVAFARPPASVRRGGAAPLSLKGLSDADKQLLGRYIRSFNGIVTGQVFFGSPSGWLMSLIIFPLICALRFVDRTLKGTKASPVAYDVKRRTTEASLSALAASHSDDSHHPHSAPLSTYAG